jgi:tRNA-Thr(GGU) m(6)t(6)A37 methyltransferase TsaA
MDRVTLEVIATVRNGRHDFVDADWDAVESRIEPRDRFRPALEGLEQFTHALVVFYMHRLPDDEPPTLTRRPRGRADMPLLGVFAQRGRMRPNPIGVTAASIVSVATDALVVRGLDALDGTPVLDLKPYVPAFDRRDARVPPWMDRLMEDYF